VLNKGLIAAFNSIITTLHLPGDWHINDLKLIDAPGQRGASGSFGASGSRGSLGSVGMLAEGGRVPGFSPNEKADNIPAMLTAGEHVQPVKRVKQYGMDLFEAFRAGAIDPKRARALLPGYADGGPVYQQLFSAVKKRFPQAKLNDGFRPGANDLHGQGLAVDLGEQGFAGGNGRPYLAAMNRDLFDRAGKYIAELIYDGAGDDRQDLKNGNPLNYGAVTNAGHHNHVHLAVRDLAGFLNAYGAGDGGGILGSAGALLGGVWDSVSGVLGNLKDSITKPISDLTSQFGNTGIARLAGGVAGTLPDRMWDKMKDTVSGLWDGLQSTASGAFNWVVDKVTGNNTMETVKSVAAQRGWGEGEQWEALNWIIKKESGGDPKAQNKTSTASGLFQHINATWMANRPASSNATRMADASVADQAIAGMNYFGNRYGSPVAAKRFWEANGYYAEGGPVTAPEAPTLYDTGGWLPPGITTVLNATNKPEPVLTNSDWNDLVSSRDNEARTSGALVDKVEFHGIDYDQAAEVWSEFNHGLRVLQAGGKYRTERVSG